MERNEKLEEKIEITIKQREKRGLWILDDELLVKISRRDNKRSLSKTNIEI